MFMVKHGEREGKRKVPEGKADRLEAAAEDRGGFARLRRRCWFLIRIFPFLRIREVAGLKAYCEVFHAPSKRAPPSGPLNGLCAPGLSC